MSLPPRFLEDLRERVSLSDLVARRVTWDRRKSNPAQGDWWAPRPFHQEKSASFHVRDREGFYKCFGCGAGGDAITFLRESENLEFMEAVRRLAEEAGVPMPDRDPEAARRDEARRGLSEVLDLAVKWTRAQLSGARAGPARAYLERRGLAAETLARFEIGFHPDGRRELFEHLRARGVSEEDAVATGMCAVSDRGGGVYDRFRDRITFPIRDGRGRAIGFGGRAMAADAQAKYLNSPQTQLFDKSRSLYNHQAGRAAAGKAGRVIVAEGYMDVIALAQAGFEEAVAPLGTAVTEHHLDMLWRMAEEPVIALDGDAAGLRAARRVLDLALPRLGPGRSLRFCLMPDGLDPDDLIRERGRDAMAEALSDALPFVEMLWRTETAGLDLGTPERRAGLDRRLRELVGRIEDKGLARHYADALAERRRELFRPTRAPDRGPFRGPWRPGRSVAGPGGRGWAPPPAGPDARTRASALVALAETADAAAAREALARESAILQGCLNHPEAAEALEAALRTAEFSGPGLSALREAILDAIDETAGADAAARAAALERAVAVGAPLATATGALPPALRPGAPPEAARAALAEAVELHAARASQRAEVAEAVREFSGAEEADEATTRRLRALLDALERAVRAPAGGEDEGADDDAEFAAEQAKLRGWADRRVWERPRRGPPAPRAGDSPPDVPPE